MATFLRTRTLELIDFVNYFVEDLRCLVRAISEIVWGDMSK